MSAHFKQDPNHPDAGDYGRNDAYYQTRHSAYSSSKKPHSRRAFVIGGVCVAAVAIVGAATPAMASGVIDDLKVKAGSVSDLLNQTLDAFKSMDFTSAYDLSVKTSAEIKDFQSELEGPLWSAAEFVPVVGSDVKAARSLVSMLGDLVEDALIPLSQDLNGVSLDTLITKNEYDQTQIDLPTLQTVVDAVKRVMPALTEAVDTVNGIGKLHIAQLAKIVDQAKEKVAPLAGKMDKVSALLDVLPNMLGAQGDRVYVVMALNNVEIRSLGGFAGQACRVSVSNGAVMLGDVRSVYDYIPSDDEWARVPLSDEEIQLYSDSVGYIAGNTCFIPDFPRVCDIWGQLWATFQGEYVDGIIALDPVLLQMLMALTGGAQMYDGTRLDGTNTVRVLLHDTYWNYMDDAEAMDAYFAQAASTALDCIMANFSSMSFSGLEQTISDAIDQYHLYTWFADSAEQATFSALGAGGEINYDPVKPELGVFLDNASWSKMEWWLDLDFTIDEGKTNRDGSKTYECSLTLSNTATQDEIDVCNDYMVGTNPEKYSADDMLERLTIYAPAGGSIAYVDHNDNFIPWPDGSYKGLQVATGQVHNQIDHPAIINFTVTTSPEATEDLMVRITPTVQDYR